MNALKFMLGRRLYLSLGYSIFFQFESVLEKSLSFLNLKSQMFLGKVS